MKLLKFIWVIFSPIAFFFVLDHFYAQRSIDLTKNWLKLDSEAAEMSHLASSLARYQRLIISSDFIRGVRIYDSSFKVVSYFGEIANDSTPSFPMKNDIHLTRLGFFSYRTTFLVMTFDQKYLVTFFFESKVGKLTFLFVSFVLTLLSFFFIAFFFWREKCEHNRRISVVVTALESYAHDIGNTLNWTKKLVDSIKSGNSSKTEELSKYVDKTLRFANGLKLEILSISKPALSETHLLDLKDIYEQCRSVLVSDVSRVQIIENFKHSFLIDADEVKISRIIINLLQNAYRHAHTFISIHTRNENNGVVFEITNDGDTLSKSLLKNIFKPFVSTNSTGLGLFICKTFVELHKGSIAIVSSNNIIKFKVWIPASIKKKIEAKRDPLEKRAIALAMIDDEIQLLEEYEKKFEESDIRLKVFRNADDFFKSLLEDTYFDAVIVDRFGPGFDSVNNNFSKIAREEFSFKGKIILYSNSVTDNCKWSDFDFCISKDFDLTVEHIAKLL